MRGSVLVAACLAAALPPMAEAQVRPVRLPPTIRYPIAPVFRNLGPSLRPITITPVQVQPPVQVRPPPPPPDAPPPSDSSCESENGRINCVGNEAEPKAVSVPPLSHMTPSGNGISAGNSMPAGNETPVAEVTPVEAAPVDAPAIDARQEPEPGGPGWPVIILGILAAALFVGMLRGFARR